DGQLRCAAATRRPLAATVRLVEDALVAGDYYDRRGQDEPVAAFAWPRLLRAGVLAARARGDETLIPPRPPRRGSAGTRLELTPRGEAVLAAPCFPGPRRLWERWVRTLWAEE